MANAKEMQTSEIDNIQVGSGVIGSVDADARERVENSRMNISANDVLQQEQFDNLTFEGQEELAKKLVELYNSKPREGQKQLLKDLGATQEIIDKNLSSAQKMEALMNENALRKNLSMKGMSANLLPQQKTMADRARDGEDFQFTMAATKLAASVGCATLSAIAAMQAAGVLDGEIAAKVMLVMVAVQAALLAAGLLADAINDLVHIFSKTPQENLKKDREELLKLQGDIIKHRSDPKKVEECLAQTSKILLKYADNPSIAKRLEGINKTRNDLQTIINDAPNKELSATLQHLLEEKDRKAVGVISNEKNSGKPQEVAQQGGGDLAGSEIEGKRDKANPQTNTEITRNEAGVVNDPRRVDKEPILQDTERQNVPVPIVVAPEQQKETVILNEAEGISNLGRADQGNQTIPGNPTLQGTEGQNVPTGSAQPSDTLLQEVKKPEVAKPSETNLDESIVKQGQGGGVNNTQTNVMESEKFNQSQAVDVKNVKFQQSSGKASGVSTQTSYPNQTEEGNLNEGLEDNIAVSVDGAKKKEQQKPIPVTQVESQQQSVENPPKQNTMVQSQSAKNLGIQQKSTLEGVESKSTVAKKSGKTGFSQNSGYKSTIGKKKNMTINHPTPNVKNVTSSLSDLFSGNRSHSVKTMSTLASSQSSLDNSLDNISIGSSNSFKSNVQGDKVGSKVQERL